MWLPSVTSGAAEGEPLSVADVKTFCRIDGDVLDSEIAIHIAGARGSIEGATSTRLRVQTAQLTASRFEDLDLLPIGPVLAVSQLRYRDRAGALQTIDAGAYSLTSAGLVAAIAPISGVWPICGPYLDAVQVTASIGYGAEDGPAVPDAVRTALLLRVRGLIDGQDIDVDSWLVNDRIWL